MPHNKWQSHCNKSIMIQENIEESSMGQVTAQPCSAHMSWIPNLYFSCFPLNPTTESLADFTAHASYILVDKIIAEAEGG
jgi:hypothetical protein